MYEAVESKNNPSAVGPYSQGVKFGNTIITSGQLPFTKQGELVSEDVKEQTQKSLENVRNVLLEAGADLDQVVKCRVFIDDMDDFPLVNEVYGEFFSPPYPARSCVEVARLPKDVKVEIEAIAVCE